MVRPTCSGLKFITIIVVCFATSQCAGEESRYAVTKAAALFTVVALALCRRVGTPVVDDAVNTFDRDTQFSVPALPPAVCRTAAPNVP